MDIKEDKIKRKRILKNIGTIIIVIFLASSLLFMIVQVYKLLNSIW
jgi:hypothetical protein